MKNKDGLEPILDALPENVRKAILSKDRRNRSFIIADDPNKEIDIEQMRKLHGAFEKSLEKLPFIKYTDYKFHHVRIKNKK